MILPVYVIYLLNVYTHVPKDHPPFSTWCTMPPFEASLPLMITSLWCGQIAHSTQKAFSSPLGCVFHHVERPRRSQLMRHLLMILVEWPRSLGQMGIQSLDRSCLLHPQCIECTPPRLPGTFSSERLPCHWPLSME